MSLSDIFWKVGTPLLFAILAWNANRSVDKLDKLDEGFTTVRVALERHETKIITVEELLKEHVRSTNGADNTKLP